MKYTEEFIEECANDFQEYKQNKAVDLQFKKFKNYLDFRFSLIETKNKHLIDFIRGNYGRI